jgi:adenylate cyclase
LNAEAHDAYLQGLSFYLRNTPADNAKAETHFKRAVELDPDFKRAYTALAKVYFKGVNSNYSQLMGKYWRTAIFLAYKNLARSGDTNFADAYVVRSRMALTKHQVKVALREAEQALDLSVNDVDALKAKAEALIYTGQYAEGRKIANFVLRLDPAAPADPLYLIGLSHLAAGSYEEGVDYFERALEHNPTTSYYAGPLAAAYGKLGNVNEAKQAFRKYLDGWLEKKPSIADVVYHFPFQDSGVLKNLADGFATAGVRERTGEMFQSRFLELDRKTRLSGQEIKSLLFGHTIEGADYWSWRFWKQKRTISGKVSHFAEPIHTGSTTTKEGESWIEDDRLCDRWLDMEDEITICSLIFRDVDWGIDAYFMVTDQGPMRFKVLNS